MSPARPLPRTTVLLRVGSYLFAAALGLSVLTFGLAVLANVEDVGRAYLDRDRLSGVDVLELRELAWGPALEPRLARDFDGDGVEDSVETEYLHREPLFDRSTSGVLRVRSGADGSLLAQRMTATPICNERWIGDVDGNGTDDLAFENGYDTWILARAR